MVRKGRLQRLAAKIISGKATDAEKRLLDAYYDAFDGMKDRDDPLTDAERAALGEAIRGRVHLGDTPVKSMRRWIPYAAAILLFASIVGYFAFDSRKSSVDGLAAADIQPGGNRATLTLADGRVIDLSEAQAGIVVADGITYLDGTQVIENGKLKVENEGPPTFNSITTPKGGTYQVTLPDGSRVWLNAASTLKYPSRFTGDVREIMLEGEAYFSVTSIISHLERGKGVTRTPFKVITSGQTVEVLGTQFNVSAYTEEAETKTTLVEGKVEVTLGTENGSPQKGLSDFRTSGLPDSAVLTPGQQATTRGAATVVNEVDVTQHTAWKDGEFNLDGVDFRETMRRLARWYDVEVVYDDSVPDDLVSGGWISRDTPLSSVLKVIEQSGLVRFAVKGRTIYVSR